jgi:hypothetical protein
LSDVITTFVSLNTASIDADGIRIPQAVARNADGGIVVAALAMSGENSCYEAFRAITALVAKEHPEELIWGWDRFTKPGQGTELGDFLSVHHWQRGRGWRFGVMEYQHSPRIVKPIVWDHSFWAPMLKRELSSMTARLRKEIGF